jgi:hypothetical protein
VRQSDGFIFLGQSKAGKTTVAQMSIDIGYQTLGDDLNFILRDGNSGYRLAAAPSPIPLQAGYSMQQPPLKGIFKLVQDDSDFLVRMAPLQTARALSEGLFQQVPYVRRLSVQLAEQAFQTCCDVARTVPGYELHFRKSSDFWDVIDVEFPPD